MHFNSQEANCLFFGKEKKKPKQKKSWIRVLLLLRCDPTAWGRSTAGSSAGPCSAPWPRSPAGHTTWAAPTERGDPGHPTLHT